MAYFDIDDASVSDITKIPAINRETKNEEITESIIDAGMYEKIILANLSISCVQYIMKSDKATSHILKIAFHPLN